MAFEEKKQRERPSEEELAELSGELSGFDLLDDKETSPKEVAGVWENTDLSGTALAFKNRIDRKKREQEKILSKSEEITRARHALMLRALMNIKRSLTDVTRIDMGDRFSFQLVADDWNGWPRLGIRLHDDVIPGAEYPSLQVSAHDRHARGTIEIFFDPKQAPECLSLSIAADLQRFPTALKKCVRTYLDVIGDIVVRLENSDEPYEDGHIESKTLHEAQEDVNEPRQDLSDDLFEDESFKEDLLEALPTLSEISALPDKS